MSLGSVSVVSLMVYIEVLWSAALVVTSKAASVSLNSAAMQASFFPLCFSAAELANTLLGLVSVQTLACVT